MNQLSNEEIMGAVMSKYTEFVQQYSTNNILGVFLLGRFNYGWGRNENDYKFAILYLPTFEDLCIGIPKHIYNNQTYLIDFRSLYKATSEWDSVEILFTKYRYINPKYEHLFNQYFDNKNELIARYNEQERLKMAYTSAETAFNNKDYYEVARLYLGAKNYSNPNNLCEDSFHIKDIINISYLDAVERGEKNEDMPLLLEEIKEMYLVANGETNIEAETAVRQGVIACISAGLNQGISADAFKQSLTTTEQKAFEAIISKLENGEGNISISKITEETNISRPVYKNLFLKMEKAKVADISNQGVKGTFVRMKTY